MSSHTGDIILCLSFHVTQILTMARKWLQSIPHWPYWNIFPHLFPDLAII